MEFKRWGIGVQEIEVVKEFGTGLKKLIFFFLIGVGEFQEVEEI